MSAPCRDWIYLEKVAFPCAVGIFEWEQHRPQTLELQIGLNLELEAAAGGDLSASVDYAACLAQIQFIAQNRRWRLLESLAIALARHLLAAPGPNEPRAQVERAIVRLRKPDVFDGRAIPCVEVQRDRSWCTLHHAAQSAAPVAFSVLHEAADAGAYHVDLASHATWRVPDAAVVHVLCGRLQTGDRTLRRGDVLPRGGHVVRNAGDQGARALTILEPLASASPPKGS